MCVYLIFTGGTVIVTSPLEVVEGDSSPVPFDIILGLPNNIEVAREIVYDMAIREGSATG